MECWLAGAGEYQSPRLWLRGDTLGLTFATQIDTKTATARRQVRRAPPKDLNAKTGLPEGYDPRSWYDRMVFAAEQSGFISRRSLKPGESKASMVIENREYNVTADAVSQVASLGERLMPEEVTSVDILLEEEGLNGPTVNYTWRSASSTDQSYYGNVAANSSQL